MQELEATWGRVLRVWWLIVWRSILGAIVIGGVAGGILGFVVVGTFRWLLADANHRSRRPDTRWDHRPGVVGGGNTDGAAEELFRLPHRPGPAHRH